MRGSVTVYFILVFVTIISVLGLTVESGRWACARLYWKQAADDSIKSVFADYCKPLFEEYGLLFVDAAFGQEEIMIKSKANEYLSYGMNPNQGSLSKGSFLYAGEVSGFEVKDMTFAIDGNGSIFRTAVYNYMKYRVPANYIKEILAQCDFINQAGVIKAFLEEIQKIQKNLEEIDALVLELNAIVEEMRLLQQEIEVLAKEIAEILAIKKPDTLMKKLLEEKKELLLSVKQKAADIVDKFLETSGVYDSVTEKVKTYLLELAGKWLNKTDIPQSIKEIIKGEIESLLTYSGGEGDVYGIEESSRILELLKEKLSSWILDTASGWLEELGEIEVIIFLPEELPDDMTEEFDPEALWKEFKANGFYSLMCPGYSELSTAEIDCFEGRAYTAERALFHKSEKTLTEMLAEDVIFLEYIRQMFSDYAGQKDNTAIKYETEYIVGGKHTDKDNIDVVINELLLIREGLNLIYIMCDSQKKSEAHALAMACLGFTGVYAAVKVLQYVILMVWALGEAMLDVRILMSGGSVPVIKTAGDWKLGLEGLLNMKEVLETLFVPEKGNGIGDWDYEAYLSVLLYLQNREETVFRVMDLIEENIQKKYSYRFKIQNCVCQTELSAKIRLIPLFSQNKLFGREEEITFGYSY